MIDSTSILSTVHCLEWVCDLPFDWHRAGTLPDQSLRAIAQYAPQRVEHTAETGTAMSTPLFWAIILHHPVCARDERNDGYALERAGGRKS